MNRIIKIAVGLLIVTMMTACQSTANYISLDAARKKALDKIDGDIVKEKSDLDDYPANYEFTVLHNNKKYEVKIDATDGKILGFEEEQYTTQDSQTNQANQNTQTTKNEITESEAGKIALNKVGGGSIERSKLDYEHGVKRYELVILYNNVTYDVDVDSTTGAIVSYEENVINDSSATSPTTIGNEKAKQIALEKTGGGSVVKNKLDYDDGIKKYEIEIYKNNVKYEIDINATNGAIMKYEEDLD